MDSAAFFDSEFAEHLAVAEATRAAAEHVRAPFVRLVAACADCLRRDGKILFFGNGGSAADAQHLATELTCRYKVDRPALAAVALTTDSSALTAAGNDFGFEQVFARQIEALGRPGDVAVGISTSGRSANITAALRMAGERGLTAAAFGGGDGGDLPAVADPLILVPSTVTARIQEMHIAVGQMLCAALEAELGLV